MPSSPSVIRPVASRIPIVRRDELAQLPSGGWRVGREPNTPLLEVAIPILRQQSCLPPGLGDHLWGTAWCLLGSQPRPSPQSHLFFSTPTPSSPGHHLQSELRVGPGTSEQAAPLSLPFPRLLLPQEWPKHRVLLNIVALPLGPGGVHLLCPRTLGPAPLLPTPTACHREPKVLLYILCQVTFLYL